MTQRLICDLPETFAAAAVVSATGFNGIDDVCAGKSATPLLFMHGTADTDIEWAGGRYVSSVPDNLAFWAAHNGCDSVYDLSHLNAETPGGSIEVYEYPGCEAALRFYAIPGGGHNWPGLTGRMVADFTGEVNMDLDASATIWAFFTQHHR